MNHVSRRKFLKKTALAGFALMVGRGLKNIFTPGYAAVLAQTEQPDIVAVTGSDYSAGTVKAVAALGGMRAFIKKGDRVGLLVNSAFKNFGAVVNPEITLAIAQMCWDAGAKEIRYLKDPHRSYWKRLPQSKQSSDLIKSLTYESGDNIKLNIKGSAVLKDAKVNKDLMDCDVFINVPITKHHSGVHFTGALKNMMGLCPFSTNSYFHFGGKLKASFYGDIDHLSQCIADLNLIRKPDLCICDATEFLSENGPSGPGQLVRPEIIAASKNPVSLDAFCCTLLNRRPDEIVMIQKAAGHGLGEMNLEKLQTRSIIL